MSRMSYMAEVRLADSVNAILNDISKGTEPEDAVIKVASAQKMAPAKVARLCEATNKIMSIHYLSSADVNKKASAFTLVDTQEVLRRLGNKSKFEKNPPKFAKTASDFIPMKSEIAALRNMYKLSDKENALLNIGTLKAKCAEDSLAAESALKDLDTSDDYINRAEQDCADSMQDIVEKVKGMGNDDAEDLANYIATTYGEEGKALIKMLSDVIQGSEEAKKPILNPTVKEGSAWISKNTAAHKLVDGFMHKVNYFTQALMMHQHAAKVAADAINDAIMSVGKVNEMGKALATPPEDNSKVKDVLSLAMERKFNDLDVKDTFANMYLGDEFLRSYEPKTVKDAYNAVLQAIPGLIKRNNSEALIKALVKRVITTNSQIDPLEVGTFITMNKDITDTELKNKQTDFGSAPALRGGK